MTTHQQGGRMLRFPDPGSRRRQLIDNACRALGVPVIEPDPDDGDGEPDAPYDDPNHPRKGITGPPPWWRSRPPRKVGEHDGRDHKPWWARWERGPIWPKDEEGDTEQ